MQINHTLKERPEREELVQKGIDSLNLNLSSDIICKNKTVNCEQLKNKLFVKTKQKNVKFIICS